MADKKRIIQDKSYEELDYVPLTNDLLFHMVFTKNEQHCEAFLAAC